MWLDPCNDLIGRSWGAHLPTASLPADVRWQPPRRCWPPLLATAAGHRCWPPLLGAGAAASAASSLAGNRRPASSGSDQTQCFVHIKKNVPGHEVFDFFRLALT